MVDKLTYSNVNEKAQSVLWQIFKSDPDVKDLTTNILDKEPENFNKGTGYPLFIVPEPEIGDDEPVTFRKQKLTLFFNCSLYTLTTPNMRRFDGKVRQAISRNLTLLRSYGLNLPKVRSKPNPYPLDDGRMAYRADIIIEMTVVVDGAEGDE